MKLMYYTELSPLETHAGIKKLYTFKTLTPFIHSIYMYSPKAKLFYIASPEYADMIQKLDTMFDAEAAKILADYRRHGRMKPIPRKIPITSPSGGIERYDNVYTFLYFDLYEDTPSDNIIFVNISEDWMKEAIDYFDAEAENEILIIDKEGRIVFSYDSNMFLQQMPFEKTTPEELYFKAHSGYFVSSIKQKKSLVTFVYDDKTEWTFISLTPFSKITYKLDKMKTATILITSIILLIGILLTFSMSRKVYTPIKSMDQTLSSLQHDFRNNQYTLKQEFLRKMLTGNNNLSSADIISTLNKFAININLDGFILLILFKIDNFRNFASINSHSDQSIYRFAIGNIVGELFSNQYNYCETIETDDDSVLLVMSGLGEINSDQLNNISDLIKQCQEKITTYLSISLSAAVSSANKPFASINTLYHECLDAIPYRIKFGHKCIIFYDNIRQSLENDSDYSYPDEKEKKLINALLLEDIEEAKEALMEIIEDSCSFSYNAVRLAITHLAFSINSAIRIIEQSNVLLPSYSFNAFLEELYDKETIDEIANCFHVLFEKIICRLSERKTNRYDELLNKIERIAEKEFCNPSLSLNSIAEEIDMSPAYLGRLFKKLTLKSIPEYINEIRLNKAKLLLQTTDLSINEISERTGFTNSTYFYKVFKKYYGVTPNYFRQTSKSDTTE